MGTSEPGGGSHKLGLKHDVTVEELNSCLLSFWYETFKSVTIPTVEVLFPDKIIQSLVEAIPPPVASASSRLVGGHDVDDNNSSCSSSSSSQSDCDKINFGQYDDNDVNWCSDDDDDDQETRLHEQASSRCHVRAELDKNVTQIISSLGGAVVPKYLWKVPQDGRWALLQGSTRCENLGDIYTLLQASTITSDLLKNPYCNISEQNTLPDNSEAIQKKLYLRKWMNFQSSDVFRCFVIHGKLIGICQRDMSMGYQKIIEEKDAIIEEIYNFYRCKIYGKFNLPFYTMDVIRVGSPYMPTTLLDFNVMDDTSILPYFERNELETIYKDIVESEQQCINGIKDNQDQDHEALFEESLNLAQTQQILNLAKSVNSIGLDKKDSETSSISKSSLSCNDNNTVKDFTSMKSQSQKLPQTNVYGNPHFRYSIKNLFNF